MGMLKKTDGFTLIEVMMAVLILAIIIVPISMIFVGVKKNSVRTENVLQAGELASMYMEDFKAGGIRGVEDYLAPDYDPDTDSLSGVVLDSENPIMGAKANIALPVGMSSKYRVEVLLSESKLKNSSAENVEVAMNKVEDDVKNAELKIVLDSPDFSANGNSFTDRLGEKLVKISVNQSGNKYSVSMLASPTLESDGTISGLDMGTVSVAGMPDHEGPLQAGENIILIKQENVTDKVTVNVENNTYSKIKVWMVKKEDKTYDVEVNGKYGYVSIEKDVIEKTKIKDGIVAATVKVYYTHDYADYYNVDETVPLVELDGSITNE